MVLENRLFIFIIGVLLLIFIIIIFICVSVFRNTNNNQLAYADINDAYIKPTILNNVITEEQCQQIIEYCRDKLFESEVIGGKHKHIRNSQQCWIPKDHPLVKPIFEDIAAMFNIAYENAEDLQVVCYRPGQYYNEHHDACCDNNDKCVEFIKRGGQRQLTVLIYLNDKFEEGPTYFPNLNLTLKPSPGSAIVFYPLATNSFKCHPMALHAGLPVTDGEKWVANVWFHQTKFV